MIDTYRHKGLRKQLAELIATKGEFKLEVIESINQVPRHLFLDKAFLERAYEDQAFPIGEGQTISQPYTVAFQSNLLNLKKGEKVLEIGTGSGYQTAVLIELGAKVFTIERQKKLYDRTKALLPQLGYQPKFFFGDGYKGQPAFAPFDKVLVTAGAPKIPEDLVEQLKPGGRLVIPVSNGDVQEMTTLDKSPTGEITTEIHGDFKFVPLLEDKNW